MAVVYIPADYNAAQDVGRAIGIWAGNRINDIENTRRAKAYADATYRPQEQPQGGTMQDYLPQVQQDDGPKLPGLSGGLWNRTNNGIRNATVSAPGAFGDALTNAAATMAPQANFQAQEPQQDPVQQGPVVPNRQSIADNLRQTNGNQYGDMYVANIKAGFSPEESRAMVAAQQAKDLDSAYGKAQNEYAQSTLNPMREQILNNLIYTTDKNGNPVVDTYNSSKVLGMIPQINRYNELASAAGLPGMDINNLNNLVKLNKPDISIMTGKNGHVLAVNKDTGKVTDEYDASDPRDRYISSSGGFYDVQTKQFITDPSKMKEIAIRQQQADAASARANAYVNGRGTGGAGGSSGTTAQVNALRALHLAWTKAHPDEDEDSSPYYDALTQALNMGGGSSGGGGDSGMSDQDRAVRDRIDALHDAGWSEEQIVAGLKKANLGEYASWAY